jgi:hypothetical protein
MPTPVDTDAVRSAAKAIFDKRIEAVVAIAQAHQNKLDKQAEADSAERAHAAAWTAGLREGWTEEELKSMGLVTPARKTPGRPKSRRRVALASPPAAPADNGDGALNRRVAIDEARYEAERDAAVGA